MWVFKRIHHVIKDKIAYLEVEAFHRSTTLTFGEHLSH